MKAKKSLGQNFLVDKNIISNIVDSVNVNQDDLVIEIGPGQGALTKKLKDKKSKIIAFEIDERMHEYLDQLESDNLSIVYKDILSVDLNDILSNYKFNNLYVVANLPYYITTPIIEKLISLDYKFKSIVVMVQKEVADRFTAIPRSKEYGYITVILNSIYDIKKLFVVKNTCFNPIPKVDSAVVRFDLKKQDNILINFEKLKKITSMSFMHKRKTLKNNLPPEIWEKIKEYLFKNNIDLNVRAEELSVDTYIDFSNLI